MSVIGDIALLLALVASLIAGIIGIVRGRSGDSESAGVRFGPAVTFALVSIASAALIIAFIIHDFSLEYVASYSSRGLPFVYLLSGWWAGNNGSLLFWAWILALLGAILVWRRRDNGQELIPYASTVVMFTEAFFLLLLVSVCNPFQRLAVVPADGQGLNPLLQNPGMIFHPPALLAGYAAMTIPFALAVAALLSRRVDNDWGISVRRWTLLAWLLLGIGNIIGAWWAYVELGWGGYWAWDPVENAGLMPWLVATAFLHSTMAQRRRGMFKMWNMVLITLAFVLTIFGTLVTRALNLSEAHGFQDQGALAPPFWIFIVVALVGGLFLVYLRRRDLQSEAEVETLASRETTFLLLNLLLVGSAIAVFVGTTFPAISGMFGGTRITVGASFFNMVNGPIFLAIILLAGLCVLIGWKRRTFSDLGRRLLWPFAGAVVVTVVIFLFGVREALALTAFALCALVLLITLQQWFRETKMRHEASKEGYPAAFWNSLAANRSRYGGYIVHIAIVLMAIGVAGSSFFGVQKDFSVKQGDSLSIGKYQLTYDNMGHTATDTDLTVTATLSVYNGGKLLGTITPQKLFAQNYEQPTTEVAIRTTPMEDLYVILLGWDQSGSVAFRVLVNPLVVWIWIGGVLMGLGGLFAFWPVRRRELAPVEVEAEGEAPPGEPAPSGSGNFCPKCGTRNEAGDRFCARCGGRLRRRTEDSGK